MADRVSSTITIWRNGNALCEVPITPQSRRVWRLMEEDNIVLDFSLKYAIAFVIGDYVDDELFGRFYITEEPAPAEYNNQNGGYRYSLRLDREYIGWKNQTFQLTAIAGTAGATRKRTNAQWSLTAAMRTHIQELEYNLQILGYSLPVDGIYFNYAYCIDGEKVVAFDGTTYSDEVVLHRDEQFLGVTDADAMAYISYSGASIFDAIKAICDAYGCEWWIKEISRSNIDSGVPFPVICFGKCEYGNAMDFKMTPASGDHRDFWDSDDKDVMTADTPKLDFVTSEFVGGSDGVINVERMTINRNEKDYGNRLFVYGSDKNIPDTYRKKLIFESGTPAEGKIVLTAKMSHNGRFYGTSADNIALQPSDTDYKYSNAIRVHYGDAIRCLLQGDDAVDAVLLFGVKSGNYVPDPYEWDTWDTFEKVIYSVGTDWGGGHYNSTQEFVIDSDVTYIFVCTAKTQPGGSDWPTEPFIELIKNVYTDTNRPLSPSMFRSAYDFKTYCTGAPQVNFVQANWRGYVRTDFSLSVGKAGKYNLTFLLNYTFTPDIPVTFGFVSAVINIDGTAVYSDTGSTTSNYDKSIPIYLNRLVEGVELTSGTHTAYILYNFTWPLWTKADKSGFLTESSITAQWVEGCEAKLTFNNATHDIIIADWTNSYKGFAFVDTPPSGFGAGSKYTIAEYNSSQNNGGLLGYRVPSNYWTDDEQAADDITLVGERRLMLPEGYPYVDSDESIALHELVEKVVVFDAIYPRCALRVTKVVAKEGQIKAGEYGDGTIRYENTANYFIAVKRVRKTSLTDADFPFEEDMQIPGSELKVTFLTREEESDYTYDGEAHGENGGYKLSGLTFTVAYSAFKDEEGNTYYGFQIGRNNDYGRTFPNLSIKPTEGDTLFLSGWNAKAMTQLGLVDAAEQELLDAGETYKEEMKNNLFTFDCAMMSDWAEDTGILQIGQKARVFHKAIDGGYKESRVIGYELALDIPYNTPTYTIGETEKYSRLRELENKLNAQVRNSTASGTLSGTGGGGGGGGTARDKQYNIRLKVKGYSGGEVNSIETIIENYDSDLEDGDVYKFFLLRWRRGQWKAARLSPNLTDEDVNNIAYLGLDTWDIQDNKQAFLGGEPITSLPMAQRYRAKTGQYVFKNTKQTTMRIGCAIYKYTGEGTHGWQRVSNVAYITLKTSNNGQDYRYEVGK